MRRLITLIPALALLGLGADPTWALVISQVALSFGIPFALVSLSRLTSDRALMGSAVSRGATRWAMNVVVVLIAVLNVVLGGLIVAGR